MIETSRHLFSDSRRGTEMLRFVTMLTSLNLLTLCCAETSAEEQSGPPLFWERETLYRTPEFRWIDQKSPIRSLAYRNENFQGRPTEVFAFYATPGTLSGDPSQDKNLPAVVLIHGGGGTAFAEWVWLWAKRGYAAIAMDLSGRQPDAPTFNPKNGELNIVANHGAIQRKRLENGGPEQDGAAKFDCIGGDRTDDWQFHVVPAVIRAHSLIRSFPEVDKERTAVTGISWGGYTTCLVASLDDRFKAAVPVYGCGFLYDGESIQRPLIDRLPEDKRQEWIETYDPSAWLKHCKVPMLFVNGTNDPHYPLASYQKSYRLVKGPLTLRIEPGMKHSHPHGWAPAEIGLFIDQHLKGGTPLPSVSEPELKDGVVSVTCECGQPLKSVQLHYSTDNGPLVDRKWASVPTQREGNRYSARVPDGATVWLFTVTDSRDALVSSGVMFAE